MPVISDLDVNLGLGVVVNVSMLVSGTVQVRSY